VSPLANKGDHDMAMIVKIDIGNENLHTFEVLRVKGKGRGDLCHYEVFRHWKNRYDRKVRDYLFELDHYYDDGAVELARKVMEAYMEKFGKGIDK
jgi:hypothetical protein